MLGAWLSWIAKFCKVKPNISAYFFAMIFPCKHKAPDGSAIE
jgi:hypothetical protein